MKKTVLALIIGTTAVTLLAGCGSETVIQNGGHTRKTSQVSDTNEDIEDDQDIPNANGEEILIARKDPTIEVNAEEFQDMLGYSFFVPDRAQNIYYYIDTDSDVGKMQFELDGVCWTAAALKRDINIPLSHPYFPEGSTELNCDFINDTAMKVHGASGEAYGYYEKVSKDWEYYYYSAGWYLDKEGYSISLDCYADSPIDSMPVEVFDFQ